MVEDGRDKGDIYDAVYFYSSMNWLRSNENRIAFRESKYMNLKPSSLAETKALLKNPIVTLCLSF